MSAKHKTRAHIAAGIAAKERQRNIETEGRERRRTEAREVLDGIKETMALAEARGEDTETTKDGRSRIRTRDSLLNLINAGKLNETQAEIGKFCRDCYEARNPLGAQTYGDSGGGGHNHEAFIGNAFDRAKKTEVIAYVERFLEIVFKAAPHRLKMFQAVLRDNAAISHFGTGEATRERNTAALLLALDAAEIGIRRWKAERAVRIAAVGKGGLR